MIGKLKAKFWVTFNNEEGNFLLDLPMSRKRDDEVL